jgi:hypothetical protein
MCSVVPADIDCGNSAAGRKMPGNVAEPSSGRKFYRIFGNSVDFQLEI